MSRVRVLLPLSRGEDLCVRSSFSLRICPDDAVRRRKGVICIEKVEEVEEVFDELVSGD